MTTLNQEITIFTDKIKQRGDITPTEWSNLLAIVNKVADIGHLDVPDNVILRLTYILDRKKVKSDDVPKIYSLLKIIKEYIRIQPAISDNSIRRTYDNPEYLSMVFGLLEKGAGINWVPYMDRKVLYLFATTIGDEDKGNKVLCKIGFSNNIVKRLNTLQEEYHCKFYLLNIKSVSGKDIEIKFYKMLKAKYPYLHHLISVDGVLKTRIFVFDKKIYDEVSLLKDYKNITTARW